MLFNSILFNSFSLFSEIIVVDSDESNTEDEGYVTMQKDEQPVSSPTITSSGLPGSSKSCGMLSVTERNYQSTRRDQRLAEETF